MIVLMSLLVIILFGNTVVFAGDGILTEELKAYPFETVPRLEDGTSLENIIQSVFRGDFLNYLEDLPKKMMDLFLQEFEMQKMLLIQLLLIVILSAILKQVSSSFEGKSVGDMSFFVCYMVLIVLVMQTFYEISGIVIERGNQTCVAFMAMLPIFLGLSVASGNVVQTTFLGSTIAGGSTLISVFLNEFFMPTIFLIMAVEMVDYISEKPLLEKFVELMKSGLSYVLKMSSVGFMMLLSLQKIGGDVVNNLTTKTAKIAVKSIPVVGDVMGGAVDTMANITSSLKSGTLVGVVIFLGILCIPLFLKLLVILFVFKMTAGVAEFICEERLVDCISGIGDYVGYLIGTLFLMQGMFLFSSVILLVSF